MGLKRVASGDTITPDQLRYVRKRYITREGLRAANAQLVNAILAARRSRKAGVRGLRGKW